MAGNANFPVWTDLIFSDQSLGTQVITNAGRKYSNTAGGAEIAGYADTRIPREGKWYWEVYISSRGSSTASVGVVSEKNHYEQYSTSKSFFEYTGPGSHDNEKPLYGATGTVWYGDSSTLSSQGTWTTGDIIGVAVDADNNKIFWAKNNTWINSANPSTGTTGGITINYDPSDNFLCLPAIMGYQSPVFTCNFGQDSSFCGEKSTGTANSADGNGYGDFYYAPPTNYLALCSANQPVPAAIDPSQDDSVTATSFHTTGIYTGTGTTKNITGLGFQPDMVWISQRTTNTTAQNYMFDSSRGVQKYVLINSNGVQVTDSNSLTAFGTDGFTLGSSSAVNSSSAPDTFVFAAWKINGGTTATNTSGTITSTVQANQDTGMSIVQYTSTGTDGTVGHGLSKPLDWYFIKKATDQDRDKLGYARTSGPSRFMYFGDRNTAFSTDTGLWSNTDPTSTVFSIDGGTTEVNSPAGIVYHAYCFHSVPGFSSFGNYYGNANADGAFIPLDFTPSMVILKQIGGTDDWGMYTNPTQSNPGTNPLDKVQRYDSTNGEQSGTGRLIDFLAGGFKLRTNNATFNEGDYYFYAAWGRLPTKFPNAFGGDFG